MRTSRKKTKKTTIVILVSAIVAVQLAIFFVWRGSSDDDESNDTSDTEIARANTEAAPLAAGDPNLTNGGSPAEEGATDSMDAIGNPTPVDINDTDVDSQNDTDVNTEDGTTADVAVTDDSDEQSEQPDVVETPDVDPIENTAVAKQPTRDVFKPKAKETRRQRIAREKREKLAKREEERERRRVAAAELARKASMEAPAEPEKGKFSISTNPSGATVALDGLFIGKSPLRDVVAAPGKHSIALSLNGYDSKVIPVRVSAGSTKNVSWNLAKKMVAVVAPKPEKTAPTLTVASRLPRTPRVSTSTEGNVGAGQGLLGSKCNGCHSKNGARRIGPRSRTSDQWDRFFSRGSHDRYRRIGADMGSGQIANVKSYLKSKSADKARNQGAGIRE